MSKPALGRGLGALLGGISTTPKPSPPVPAPSPPVPVADHRDRVERVPLTRIRPCPFQPRKDFSAESIKELADSIREQGIVQPLIVRDKGDHFELIAGERRWRAAQSIGLAEAPVIVREADDRAVLELALIENLQRENLNPIEEAQGYSQLIEQFQLTQENVSTKVGKSRAVVANALRLLRLPPPVQLHLRDGRLSVGHAKVILGLATGEQQTIVAERILKEGLNVRQTEELVAHLLNRSTTIQSAKTGGVAATPPRDIHTADLENRIQQRLGTKVSLRYKQGKGAVEIRFFNDDDLDRILQIIGVKVD